VNGPYRLVACDDRLVEPTEKSINQFRTALSNMMQVDRDNFSPVVQGCLNPSLRERHLTYDYQRASFNVEGLVNLPSGNQFQAMTMLARALFEIAVEMRLINGDAKAAEKVEAFNNIEKLRAAKRIVKHADDNPDVAVHSENYRKFVQLFETQIGIDQKRIWNDAKMSDIHHWTLKPLPKRAEDLGGIFHQIYQVNYSELSWYSHGGTTGVMNMTSETALMLAGICYKTAADSYAEILATIIREFHLDAADDIARTRILHACYSPFAETPEEKAGLLREMGVMMKPRQKE
jgi:hypothetical protein